VLCAVAAAGTYRSDECHQIVECAEAGVGHRGRRLRLMLPAFALCGCVLASSIVDGNTDSVRCRHATDVAAGSAPVAREIWEVGRRDAAAEACDSCAHFIVELTMHLWGCCRFAAAPGQQRLSIVGQVRWQIPNKSN
jgi:hypothetical protein